MKPVAEDTLPSSSELLGIKITSIRLSAAGYMLDARYRVTDPDRAVAFLQGDEKPFLIDEKTGQVLSVPVNKLGSMRSTTQVPDTERLYWMFFTNPKGMVKSGDKVSIGFGDYRIENLVVE